jgi:hypothetical protein
MITIFSFIPNHFIKCNNNNGNNTISLFSSIKTSILNQTYTDWQLLLVTNVENVSFDHDHSEDPRIKIVYTSDSYLNLNTLFALNKNNDNDDNNNNNNIICPECKYISIFDLENDIWNANKLQIQYNLMQSNNYDIIGCDCTPSNERILATNVRTVKKIESSLFKSCPFVFSTILIKRELFQHYDETIFQKECAQCNDNNFRIIHSEINTLMAQFHSLLLFMTLTECNIYCIHYSHLNQNNNNNNNNGNINNNSNRVFNYALVETSLQSKLTFMHEHKTCDHSFFIDSKNYFEERYMRIKFFSDFCSSEWCKHQYEEMCRVNRMDNYGPNKYLYITINETYTHVILLNCPIVPNISVPPDRVLGLAFEPIPYLRLSYDFIRFAEKRIGLYYIGHKHPNLTSELFKEHHGFMWHTTHPLKQCIKNAKNPISIIVSNKIQAPGNAYRHKLASFILINNLPIDVWGNGTTPHSNRFPNHANIKGPFKDKEPYESYTLSICIENYQHPHYFSEKISNCFICDTTPIYLGCVEIDTYFPGQVVHLSGNLKRDCALLIDISKNPTKYVREIKHDENENVLNVLKNLPWN